MTISQAFNGVVAIDVGYGNNKIEWGSGNFHFPARVARVASSDAARADQLNRQVTRLNRVLVEVDGKHFFVGPDMASAVEEPSISDDYSSRPEYKALVIGGLHYMFEKMGTARREIRQLVLGLPMSTFQSRRPALVEAYSGAVLRVPTPDQLVSTFGPTIEVRIQNVEVVPQPVGALIAWGFEAGRTDALQEGVRNLVIDPGERTFDWYAGNGTKPIYEHSGAIPVGKSSLMFSLTNYMTKTLGTHISYKMAEAVFKQEQLALAGQTTTIPTAPFREHARMLAADTVDQLVRRLPEDSFDNIVLTGGALDLFEEPLRQRLPTDVIRQVRNPVMGNATGFRIWGGLD